MKLIRIAFLFCALAWVVSAHAQGGMIPGPGTPASSGGGFTPSCAQSSTFLAAATGVTLPADKMNYDTLICGLVSDGVWNFDVLYIWAAPTQATALINLANPGTFNGTTGVVVGSCGSPPCFTAYQGFTGDASTFYIDSGFNPTTATSPNFVQNSANVGAYILSARATGNLQWAVGCAASGCATSPGPLFAPSNGGSTTGALNSATGTTGSSSSAQGSWNVSRVSSSHESTFLNSAESEVSGASDTSAAVENGDILFFTLLTGFGFTSDQIAAGWIGKGVGGASPGTDGVNSCKINNRINTYMATLASPKNVYSNSAC